MSSDQDEGASTPHDVTGNHQYARFSPADTSTRPITPLSGVDVPWWSPEQTSQAEKRNIDRILIGAVGVLSALVLVVGALLVGRLVGGVFTDGTPGASVSHSIEGMPRPPGQWRWDELTGGECLQPYESAWADEFTVVACSTPHTAQLVRVASWPAALAAAFPGQQALASQVNGLCNAADVLNPDVVTGNTDLQVQGTFPVTVGQWEGSQRSYYCFVTRGSGQALTGSLL